MAIDWHAINSYLEFGVDWFASTGNTSVTIAPKIYRWDKYDTNNYGGSFDDTLSPDPSGDGAWYGLPFGSGSGTRQIDAFTTRTYARGHSAYTVSLRIAWKNAGTAYDYAFHSVPDGSKTWTLTVPALASYTVNYSANGGTGGPTSSQTKWYGETLTLSTARPTRTGYTFQGWATTSNASKAAYQPGGSYTANSSATMYAVWKVVAPAAPTVCSSTRNSDTKNTVTWTRGANADITYASVKVERSVDGGSWSQIASVGGTATSYADTSTSANHYYRYRVRASNSTGNSDYATSGYTYNTPSAPTKVTASRLAETTVKLSIANNPKTATALELQRSTDGESWNTVATVSGAKVTETTDAPGGGTFYYRARNTRGSLASAWSPASKAVVTITPPNAPTLNAPASGEVVSKAAPEVLFRWSHNPIDGSDQTAAELRYSTDGGSTWVTVAIGGSAASRAVSNAFAVNSTVTWGVRTKGAHEDFGPWSGNRVFRVYQEPSVSFAQPADGFVVENTPVDITLQYDDPSGEVAGVSLSISDGSSVVWSRDNGASLYYSIPSTEWVPDNGRDYHMTAEVRSSSTLTASATRTVGVSFVPPMSATAKVEPDEDTGRVGLTVAIVQDDSLEPATSIDVFREFRGKRVPIAGGLSDGAGVVDDYAPANVDYRYVLVTTADSGATSTAYVDARLDTRWFYFMWGGEVAKGRINPEGSRKVTRPNRRRVHFAGRPLPVSFDDGSVLDERSVSVLLRTKAEADEFARMVMENGRCVYKSGDGDVIHADVEISDKQAWMQPTYYGSVSVSVYRIDGRDL